ncbi:MAG: alpha/beta hydrolase [Vicinamibacterales bacterium]
MTGADDPHAAGDVVSTGAPLGRGRAVVIAVHGRNASPRNILDLARPLAHPDVSWLAPAAANNAWYPLSFLAPREHNEPYLTSALRRLAALVTTAVTAGVPRERVVVLGFSQGACLAAEFVASHPARYGGLIAFSGGLIGPPGSTWDTSGSLAGTPAFLGCSDVDTHVPKVRVEESAAVLGAMGAAVTLRIYPGMGHLVNDDELDHARAVIALATEPTG